MAKVLGVDTVALNEIMKNFQGTQFFGLPPFLEALFGTVTQKTAQTRSLQPGSGQSALPAGSDSERPREGGA